MSRAAFKAAQGLLHDFREIEHLHVSKKGPGDFVSIADKRAEKSIYTILQTSYPSYNFLMEEGGEIINSVDSPSWIIDRYH